MPAAWSCMAWSDVGVPLRWGNSQQACMRADRDMRMCSMSCHLCFPQVYDLSEYRPDKVLRQIWSNLQQQEQLGNLRAALVRSRLRILACGGDGTIAWILKVIQQLNLQPHPAVAIMPLGTGTHLMQWSQGAGTVLKEAASVCKNCSHHGATQCPAYVQALGISAYGFGT